MTDHKIIFEPIQLGNLSLPNRVVMTALKLGYGNKAGEVSERHIAFYRRRAEGKVGLMTSEPMFVQKNGRELPTQLGIHNDDLVPGLQKLTDAVHNAGSLIMAHINHAGRAVNPKLVPPEQRVSASEVVCPANQVTPVPLTIEEIIEIVAAFGAAARRAYRAGFDAIELPFSHGYLVHQFLSPHSNLREDAYGGSLKKRLRFGEEIISAVRTEVGADFPIIVRMNAKDYVPGGLEVEDAVEIARYLERFGVQALSITSGSMCESVPFCLYPTGTPKANLLPMASQVKSAVSIPIIVAGRIRTPQVATEALDDKQTDLIGLGRPFLADPDWVLKNENEDQEAILLCAACHQGCLGELRSGRGTSCMFNPLTGREHEIKITAAAEPRRVMVVGGGPGGMEAALIAAQRGHQVTLYERDNILGGRLREAVSVPYKDEFSDLIRYQQIYVERNGVDVHLNTEVTLEKVLKELPDVIVLALGADPILPPFPGLEDCDWTTAYDLLDGKSEVNTETAFIVGAGTAGLETAEYLAMRGVSSIVVKRKPEVGGKLDPLAQAVLLRRLEKAGVEVRTGIEVIRFEKDKAGNTTVVARPYPERENAPDLRFPAETVIIALGLKSDRSLAEALEAQDGLQVQCIGDYVEPREALEAVWEGFEIGNRV